MRISGRNMLKGTVNAEVTLQIAKGVEVVAMISLRSAESLSLEKGKPVYAIIKATSVMVGVDD